ncbi:twitching motility protein PilT [Clostridia bacterium]|nr:twitching motility protein PilT [Clostridia bacterium]
MKIMIDSNVVVDVYQDRELFADNSAAVLKLSESGKVSGFISASMITDIYFILGRHIKDDDRLRQLVRKLLTTVTLTDVFAKDVTASLDSPVSDFEDALVAQCAKRVKADYIVTRNEKDFAKSAVPAISPEDFLHKFFPA